MSWARLLLSSPVLLAFACGCAWVQILPALPSPAQRLALLGLAFGTLIGAAVVRASVWRRVWLIAGGLLFGLAWAAWRADLRLADALAVEFERVDVQVVGTIASLPDPVTRGVRFDFHVEQVEPRAAGVPRHIGLAWYAGFGGAAQGVLPDLQPGQRWQLVVRLKRPHGNANPHGFDSEAWLLERGVRATGYVRAAGARNRLLDEFVLTPANLVERCRALLRARIARALAAAPQAGVITALVIGDQRAISPADWQVYARTGISHLISISGLHVTMLAGAAAALAMALWRQRIRRGTGLPTGLDAHRLGALAGAGIALLYCLLAGMGVPARRTLVMLTIVALALWLGRPVGSARVLVVALAAVVLLDPWAVGAAGFWLSFGAVALIFYVHAGRLGTGPDAVAGRSRARHEAWLDALRLAARTQWAMTLGLVPLGVWLFHQVSLVGPLANAVAIPLISFVVTPLALAGAVLPGGPGDVLLWLAEAVMDGLAGLLAALASLEWAVWPAAVAPVWTALLAVLGVLWCLAPPGWPVRPLGALALLPALFWPAERPAADALWLTVMDVGQGSAVLIETRRHRVLYDTGPFYSPEADGGSRVVLPYLRARGIGRLDGLVVTHHDNDHSGGALSLLDGLQIGWLASSLAVDHRIVERAARPQPHTGQPAVPHYRCSDGQSWMVDGWRFAFLHPTAASHDEPRRKANARSCVLRIDRPAEPQRAAVLLTGDIEQEDEAELVRRHGAAGVRAAWLLVPHHGSLTSSTPAFLDAVAPHVALVQAGHLNRFGHPRPAVLERYAARGVTVYRTDQDGAVQVRLERAADHVQAWRRERVRYWHGR